MYIANTVINARKEKNYTQQQLADMVDVSRRTIVSLEKGNYTPSLLLAFQLAEALEMPIDQLFQLKKDDDE
jgi:putative transcriptional regulator